jgi:hypothetical protein
MSIIKGKNRGAPPVPFLAEFQPFSVLWSGPNPPYPSENSARWAFRSLQLKLAESNAVAFHCGRYLVHPTRWAQVAEQAAIDRFVAVTKSRRGTNSIERG